MTIGRVSKPAVGASPPRRSPRLHPAFLGDEGTTGHRPEDLRIVGPDEIGWLVPRQRASVTGRISAVRTTRRGSGPAYECDLEDGTGSVLLVFIGRRAVPGMIPGAALAAEGTVGVHRSRLMILNPHYSFLRDACSEEQS
jgi:hypothetical protein